MVKGNVFSIWGTKWDVIEPIIKEDQSLILGSNSACSPNIPLVKTMCKIIEHMFNIDHHVDSSRQLNMTTGNMEWNIVATFFEPQGDDYIHGVRNNQVRLLV